MKLFVGVCVLTVVGESSPAVVLFEKSTQHLMAHLPLFPQGHVRGHHLIVCVQVVTANATNMFFVLQPHTYSTSKI